MTYLEIDLAPKGHPGSVRQGTDLQQNIGDISERSHQHSSVQAFPSEVLQYNGIVIHSYHYDPSSHVHFISAACKFTFFFCLWP